ncbi:MAG TPA: TlyA family RNA methyltransferase [Thermopetrobacter sp.]|nr:TlyA family RNA methyltransferase [Thermopetrobacter sp.]
MSERDRLDRLLVTRGLAPSRARAADAIRRGAVTVDGRVVTKPGAAVAADAAITIEDAAAGYVSRAALKLIAALDHFDIPVKDAVALDVGASTGGFTQVLLERGAAQVFAVDVGGGQLADVLRDDRRVVALEGVNARELSAEVIPQPVDVITADVSFISLRKALPAALELARPGAWLAALIKPQFEAGPEQVGKGGIVRDEQVRERVCAEVAGWLEDRGWLVAGVIPSPIAGADGNVEYLIGALEARGTRP